ncbi:hypothetical protein C8R46DRAFT_1194730 [Mycena filopes]|nr:hypothetical protein C8R46DRAFT_1194730 [Mycena filopes]
MTSSTPTTHDSYEYESSFFASFKRSISLPRKSRSKSYRINTPNIKTVSLRRASVTPPPAPSADDASSVASSSKRRDYPARCMDMVISGISAILIMPMPFLDGLKSTNRRTRTRTRRTPTLTPNPTPTRTNEPPRPRPRNSLILPEVPMPPSWTGEPLPDTRPSVRSTRPSPPPLEARRVRFVIVRPPPSGFKGRGDGEEPAWCDFMGGD